jgi:MoaA/NifB/PqqE/SkfB family radical SAM enzyme
MLQIIKALNLLVNKHEYFNFTVSKVGRPSGFMLDTVNACQLGCATCQHSYNKEWTSKTFVPMPTATMKPDTFDAFIHAVGLRSYAGHFYNNSEPFLNKRTPQYLRIANMYRINTMISSNMSIPGLDAEAIVDSGLNLLMTAIDGTTQEVYQRYRRGGHLDLVFENVRRIVEAKKRLKSATPRLRWQFLTFRHNIHQIDDAIKMAQDIGYDSFNIATPYDVSSDDPSIEVAVHPKAGTDVVFNPAVLALWKRDLKPIAAEIESGFRESFVERYEEVKSTQDTNRSVTQGFCDWLHLGIISDALGRVHPCCLPDYKDQGSFVFGSLQRDGNDLFNSEKYQQARLLFANEGAYCAGKLEGREKRSKCEKCSSRPLPQIGLGAIDGYFQTPSNEAVEVQLNDPVMRGILLGWSRHNEVFHF